MLLECGVVCVTDTKGLLFLQALLNFWSNFLVCLPSVVDLQLCLGCDMRSCPFQVANLACSMSNNEEGVKMVRISAAEIDSLCPQV